MNQAQQWQTSIGVQKQLGVAMDKKIPMAKLKEAAKEKGKLGKRARLAITLKKLSVGFPWQHPAMKHPILPKP